MLEQRETIRFLRDRLEAVSRENRLLWTRCRGLEKMLEQERQLVGEYRARALAAEATPSASVVSRLRRGDGSPVTQADLDEQSRF